MNTGYLIGLMIASGIFGAFAHYGGVSEAQNNDEGVNTAFWGLIASLAVAIYFYCELGYNYE